jgi:putative transposase
VNDALTDLLRDGARQMLAAAVEAEVQEFLSRHQALQDEQGRQGGNVNCGVRHI